MKTILISSTLLVAVTIGWLARAPLAEAAREFLESPEQQIARISTEDRDLRDTIRSHFVAADLRRERVAVATRMGNWQSDGYERPLQNWTVQAERDRVDGTLRGRLLVVGSAALSDAQISGKADGENVSGVIINNDGVQVGTFSGSVYERGMAGTYATIDGQTGKWSYEDPEGVTSTAELAKTVPAAE